jgi:hypothetical protein
MTGKRKSKRAHKAFLVPFLLRAKGTQAIFDCAQKKELEYGMILFFGVA